jgi:hypothetical protein
MPASSAFLEFILERLHDRNPKLTDLRQDMIYISEGCGARESHLPCELLSDKWFVYRRLLCGQCTGAAASESQLHVLI